MIAPILKWIFIQYNKRGLKNKLFDGKLSIEGLQHTVTIYRDEDLQWIISHQIIYSLTLFYYIG
jgi:hypothetical protein